MSEKKDLSLLIDRTSEALQDFIRRMNNGQRKGSTPMVYVSVRWRDLQELICYAEQLKDILARKEPDNNA